MPTRKFDGVASLMRWIKEVSSTFMNEPVQFHGEVRYARINRRGVLDIELVETASMFGGSYSYQIPCQLENPQDVLGRLKIGRPSEMEAEDYTILGLLQFRVTQNRYVVEVIAIEPFGKGAIEKRRKKILEKLEREGLYPVEKLESIRDLGDPITKIAVLASPGTRGLVDMLTNIAMSRIVPEVYLYPVAVEGPTAPASMVDAIDLANSCDAQLIVIVRGGGAQSGLIYLDEERLARRVIQSRIPVIVGIGHTEDVTLLDYVARLSLETPTAVGREIAYTNEAYLEALERSSQEFQREFVDLCRRRRLMVTEAEKGIRAYGLERVAASNLKNVTGLARTLRLSAESYTPEGSGFWRLVREYRKSAENLLRDRFELLSGDAGDLFDSMDRWLQIVRSRLETSTAVVRSMNPIRSLFKGGAIVTDEYGHPVTTIDSVDVGDELNVRVEDGTISSEVVSKAKKDLPKPVKTR